MNTRRVAALLRELADELDEREAQPEPAKRRAAPPAPKSVDEVTRERARRVIRSRGLVGSPR